MKVAVFTARGGSKRIPNKNTKEFLGSPLISYPLKQALNCGFFDHVVVSTDSEEIRALAVSLGAEVPFVRSKKNSDDYATTMDVLKEVLGPIEEFYGQAIDHLCCIYPTAVFLKGEWIKSSYDQLRASESTSLCAVCAYSPPIQRSFFRDENGALIWNFPEFKASRSQDLDANYYDVGQFYWLTPEHIRSQESVVIPGSQGFQVSSIYNQDIDTPEDWVLAEVKYKHLMSLGAVQ